MKLNWAFFAAFLYLSFVAGMGYLVYRSTQENIDLVISNYYEQDKLFAERYEQQQNLFSLPGKVKITSGNPLLIDFSVSLPDSGTIQLYRPDNAKLDKTLPIETNESGVMAIETSELKRGLWKLIIRWQSGNTKFYLEENVFL